MSGNPILPTPVALAAVGRTGATPPPDLDDYIQAATSAVLNLIDYAPLEGEPVPPAITLAAKATLQQIWRADQTLAGGQRGTPPPAGFAIPARAAELLRPWLKLGGFA